MEKSTEEKLMTRRSFSRILAGLSAAFLMTGGAGQVQAASYAYSVQQLSNFVLTGGTVGTTTAGSNNVAIQTGSPNGSVNTLGTTDAAQAFVGTGAPAENTFTPKGQVNPDYVRSDSLVTSTPFTGTFATNTVAEGFLSTVPGNSSGTTSITLSTPLTLATSSIVTLNFVANNTLQTQVTGPLPASAQASFTFDFTIQNAAGAIVFSSSPAAVNQSISQTTIGSSTGTTSVNTPVAITTGTALGAGSYTISITQTSRAFLSQGSVVPEPSSLLMGGMAFGLLGSVIGWRNRKATCTA